MSDAGASPPGDPTDDALPDLFGGASGWDGPLPDLAPTAGAGGATAPGAGGAGDGSESAGAPADGALPDLTGSPEGDASLPDLAEGAPGAALTDLGASAPSGRGGAPGASAPDDDWAPAPPVAGRRGAAGADAPRRPRRARRGRGTARPAADRDLATAHQADEPDGDDGPNAEPLLGTDAPDAPRGLATGGLAGGLEPGTLFGPDPGAEPAAGTGRGGRRKGRRSRRGGDDGAPDAPERPLTAEERLQHALKLAYAHLTKRDRTVSEVRAHLEKREVDEPSIAGALAELIEFRYLDDERFAARFVEDKRRLEGWGHLRIEQGLRRTGVPREVADAAVADDPLRGDEATLAVEALEQRLAGRAPEDDRARQKALRLLATKGYPLDTAYAAVRAYERRCAERDDD